MTNRINHLLDYNQKDFEQNPRKYQLFKTAVIKNRIINTETTVEPDTVVGLTYLKDVYNALYRRTEPLYRLHTGDLVFGNNLREFCL